jgi:shikimate dehydrogenase
MTALPQYAVLGNPIKHSLSPRIHSLFASATDIPLEYRAILVEEDDFEQSVLSFAAQGGKGLNITVPFKLDAWHIATQRSERAQLAGAVNTLTIEPSGNLSGDNTDGAGIVRDISINLENPIAGTRILILGAGGAVRGVLGPLLAEQPEHIHIANRTASKAEDLAASFHDHGPVTGGGLDELGGEEWGIVINGTAASLAGQVPDLPETLFAPAALAYDMMYSDKPTPFMEWATAHGASETFDGLGMLVEQAAESFHVWHGVRPETGPVIDALRGG